MIVKYLKIWVVALITLVLTLSVLLLLVSSNILTLDTLVKGLREATSPLIALSVSLIVFPIISVSTVEDVVSKARSSGIEVNQRLVKDYIDGCFMIFILSMVNLLLLVFYAFTGLWVIVFTTVSVLVSLIFVMIILMSGLWQITRLIIELAK